jgi:hypothetical protein
VLLLLPLKRRGADPSPPACLPAYHSTPPSFNTQQRKQQDNISKEMKQRLRKEYYGLGGAENTVSWLVGGGVVTVVESFLLLLCPLRLAISTMGSSVSQRQPARVVAPRDSLPRLPPAGCCFMLPCSQPASTRAIGGAASQPASHTMQQRAPY